VKRVFMTRRGLVVTIVTLLAVSSVGVADAQLSTARHGERAAAAGVIPFTSATLTPKAGGGYVLAYNAPGVKSVTVMAGTTAATTTTKVASGIGHATISLRLSADGSRPWVRLVPSTGASLQITVRDLGLASDPNFRDAGGYRTTTGQWVRMGLIYRSAALTLSPADLATVEHLGIRYDYDLRTPQEETADPDVVPSHAIRVPLSVLGPTEPSLNAATQPAAITLIESIEREFITLPSAKSAYHALFTDLADHDGTSVYHCSAGKDRTGWASAVLLTILGVPQKTVMADYLLSNRYYLDSPAVQQELAAMPTAQAAVYRLLLQVAPDYLEAGFAQVKASYGSMDRYLSKGLHLSAETIARLRTKLLVGRPN
jgi:protein-tyrosine phosphatase